MWELFEIDNIVLIGFDGSFNCLKFLDFVIGLSENKFVILRFLFCINLGIFLNMVLFVCCLVKIFW